MDLEKAPINLTVMDNNRKVLSNLEPVTSVDIYDGFTERLADSGLFSTTIFGKTSEPRRQTTFSYIDLQTKIIHPLLFKNIESVAGGFIEIIKGIKYATWDDKKKTFIDSDAIDGETGFSFFLKHFKDIKFERNDSDKRGLKIDVLDKFRDKGMYDFVLVIPAGMRDIEEDKKGTLSQDEINDFYRSLIGLSKNIDANYRENKFNDGTKNLMQRNFNAIYELLFSYLKGKSGLIQNKWAKRRIENGTRSVLSAMDQTVEDLKGHQAIQITETVVGLYQSMKGNLPLIQHAFKSPLIMEIFAGNGEANLINMKTMKLERASIDSRTKELFTTEDGVNDLINQFSIEGLRDKEIKFKKHCLALMYRDDKGFKVVRDPETLSKEQLAKSSPITWAELFYYLSAPVMVDAACWITRYPIATTGSCYPSLVYMKTTVDGEALFEYDDDFNLSTEMIYREMPIKGKGYIDTLVVSPAALLQLGGDHDGDTGSADFVMTVEARKEVHDFYANIDNWFNGDKLIMAFSTDMSTWTFKSLSAGEPVEL